MATFTAFNAAGAGFNMTSTTNSGWSFMVADPRVVVDLAYDDGSTAIYDIYGSLQVDELKANYWTNGYDIVVKDLIYKNYGSLALTITGLKLYTTQDDLAANAWYVNLNAGNDTFSGNDYADVIRAGYGNDLVYGYGGSDILYGNAGRDKIDGGSGDDDLYGGSGLDILSGGVGSDYLSGGANNDILTGGSGEDYFAFDAKLSRSNIDQVTDFNPAEDTIMLDNRIFRRLATEGWLSDAAFTIGPKAGDASDRIIYNDATGALLYDPDGTGSLRAIKFAQLTAGLNITSADFYVL